MLKYLTSALVAGALFCGAAGVMAMSSSPKNAQDADQSVLREDACLNFSDMRLVSVNGSRATVKDGSNQYFSLSLSQNCSGSATIVGDSGDTVCEAGGASAAMRANYYIVAMTPEGYERRCQIIGLRKMGK